MVFVLAPLLLVIVLFFVTRYVVENQIRVRGELTVTSFQAKISGIMKEAEMVASAILNDNEFRENSAAELQTWDNSLAVTNSLSEAKASSDFVDKVYVIDEKQGKIYSDDGAVFSMDSLDAILRVNFLSGLDYKDVSGWNYVFYNSHAPPLYVTEIRSEESGERIGTILILLRKGDFLKLLYDTDADCFCLFNDNFSISTVMTTETVPDWRDPEAVSRLLGDKVECIYREGRDFTYMAAISKWSYYAPVRLVLVFFGLYFALILILGLGGAELLEGSVAVRVSGDAAGVRIEALPVHAGGRGILHRLNPASGEGHTHAPGFKDGFQRGAAAQIVRDGDPHPVGGHGFGRKAGRRHLDALLAFHHPGVGHDGGAVKHLQTVTPLGGCFAGGCKGEPGRHSISEDKLRKAYSFGLEMKS